MALITTMWGAMFGTLQAAAVARAEGVSVKELRPFLGALEPVIRNAVAGIWNRVEEGRYAADETTRASIAVHRSGVEHLIATCKERGIDTRVPEAFSALLARVEDGEEIAAVVNVLARA